MPLRWIEEREARQARVHARYQAHEVPASEVAAKPLWVEWLRRWIAASDATEAPEITVEPPLR